MTFRSARQRKAVMAKLTAPGKIRKFKTFIRQERPFTIKVKGKDSGRNFATLAEAATQARNIKTSSRKQVSVTIRRDGKLVRRV